MTMASRYAARFLAWLSGLDGDSSNKDTENREYRRKGR